MSPSPSEKLTLPRLAEMTGRGERIVMVTAYDAPSARLADEAGIDLILVGDSAAMVVLGHDSTLPVTLDEMLMLTSAVSRVTRRALVVGDLPFGSYQESDEKAVASAVRMVKEGGADIVKLEGADRRLSRVRAIGDAGIPVMGHIGLTPQSATLLGGYRAQGRTAGSAHRLYDAALASEAAGCCALVLEAVPAEVAGAIARALTIPVIGIGAGPDCDGQVLVWHDLLGVSPDPVPRFVKRYADLAGEARRALEAYVEDVREGRFPEEQHTYTIPDEELAAFEAWLPADRAQAHHE
jgi:3-methyl-2-oxobutanoate hydroxymethyltransferase